MTDAIERFTITGHVQGVGFRWWAKTTAERLGLRGAVRNRRDGSVEALASGPQDRLDAFADACRTGPRGADVDRVQRAPASRDDLPPGQGFEIVRGDWWV